MLVKSIKRTFTMKWNVVSTSGHYHHRPMMFSRMWPLSSSLGLCEAQALICHSVLAQSTGWSSYNPVTLTCQSSWHAPWGPVHTPDIAIVLLLHLPRTSLFLLAFWPARLCSALFILLTPGNLPNISNQSNRHTHKRTHTHRFFFRLELWFDGVGPATLRQNVTALKPKA